VKNLWKCVLAGLALALITAAILAPTAKAQLDAGNRIYLYENGVRVGEVYVPYRAPGQTQYVEDWVLYPNYMYPGPRFIGTLQIVPSPTEQPYASEQDFFQRVPFTTGSKYIRVLAQESNYLPR